MAKKKITDLIEEITADFLAENGLELYNSEFVKEGRDWFLRVYIDKLPAAQIETVHADTAGGCARETAAEAAEDAQTASNTQYVSTDDCEKVSRFSVQSLTDWTRSRRITIWRYLHRAWTGELLREKDFIRFAGEQVDISFI